MPRLGDAFEAVFAAIVEADTGSGNEIDDGARHQHFAGCRGFADAMGKVNGDAGQVSAAPFDLAGVDPDPNIETDLARGVADRSPAADRTRGAIEGGEHAVAGGLTVQTREPTDLTIYRVVVTVEHGTPRPIADSDQPVGGADDIGEHQRGEHPVVMAAVGARAGQELFDLFAHHLRRVTTAENRMVRAG